MSTIVWISIAVVAVLVIAVLAVAAKRRSEVKHAEHVAKQRERAAELRDEAREATVEARSVEAEAATARAEADRARLEADRLDEHATDLETEAAEVGEQAHHRLAEADRIDPDVDADGHRADPRRTAAPEGAGHADHAAPAGTAPTHVTAGQGAPQDSPAADPFAGTAGPVDAPPPQSTGARHDGTPVEDPTRPTAATERDLRETDAVPPEPVGQPSVTFTDDAPYPDPQGPPREDVTVEEVTRDHSTSGPLPGETPEPGTHRRPGPGDLDDPPPSR